MRRLRLSPGGAILVGITGRGLPGRAAPGGVAPEADSGELKSGQDKTGRGLGFGPTPEAQQSPRG